MRKIITLLCCCILLMTACKPKKKDTNFQLPAISDIAMYQVNPRVFAPDHSLNAVAARTSTPSAR